MSLRILFTEVYLWMTFITLFFCFNFFDQGVRVDKTILLQGMEIFTNWKNFKTTGMVSSLDFSNIISLVVSLFDSFIHNLDTFVHWDVTWFG